MIVVSNTSPLVNLLTVNQATVLEDIFGIIHIPSEVEVEFELLRQNNTKFKNLNFPAFIKVQPVQNRDHYQLLRLHLDDGEATAIALAMEMKADLLLMDEILGRGEAGRLSIKTTGCIGILLQAKSKKLIPAIRPILEQLESEAGFYLSQEITDYALELAGE